MNRKVRDPHQFFILLLIIVLLIGIFLLYMSSGNPSLQWTIVLLFSFFYFLWGVIYHSYKGDIHPKIVVEYLLISLLSVLLLKGAIFR